MSSKIIILIAIVCLIVAVVFGARSYMFVSKSEKTSARVMRFDNPKGKMVTPVFEYSVKGKYYEYKGASTSPGNYELNDKEIIYYDPAHPVDSKLGTFMNLWFVPLFCGGFFLYYFLSELYQHFQKNLTQLKHYENNNYQNNFNSIFRNYNFISQPMAGRCAPDK